MRRNPCCPATLAAAAMLFTSPFAFAQAGPDFLPASLHQMASTQSWITVAGDWNGDGWTDLATTDPAILGYQINYGTGPGKFNTPLPFSIGSLPVFSVPARLNGDATTDLVVITPTNLALLTFAPGGASMGLRPLASGHVTAYHAATADFNRDGLVDLVVAGTSGFSFLRGLGAGNFAPPVLLPQAIPGTYLLVGDLNNDGNLDFTGTGATTSYSYLGRGDGTFALPVSTIPLTAGGALADFNGDGKLDALGTAISARQDGSNQAFTVALGQGDGRFLSYLNYVLNTPISLPVTGDFNADGRPDVALWASNRAALQVYLNRGNTSFAPASLLDAGQIAGAFVLAADVDGNGSTDLVATGNAQHRVYRNTHGNPPLLSLVQAAPGAVVGGAGNVLGTVQLGGVAPAGGALVSLASSHPALAFFPAGDTVTIPAGAASATFPIATTGVAAATQVTLSASWNGQELGGPLQLVAPYTLSQFTLSSGSLFGGLPATGTITLSGPADAAATVLLNSNSVLASVPASVTVPPGATSANFPITLQTVAADTPVNLAATLAGITQQQSLVILAARDQVAIGRAILTTKTAELKLDATSTNAAATLSLYHPTTGAQLGTLTNNGGGKYSGTVLVPLSLRTITVKSSLGGAATAAIQVK